MNINSLKHYWNTLKDAAYKVSKKNGQNQLFIMADMVLSTIKYGASPNNYLYFHFNELTHMQRNTYLTHTLSQKIIKKYNNPDYIHMFEDKTLFAQKFNDFFGRQWVDLRGLDFESFEKFISNKKEIIYKPIYLSQGKGIEKIVVSEHKNIRQLYDYLKSRHSGNGMLEDWIQQHEEIARIYSKSVNCVRLVTILRKNTCDVLEARLVIGNGLDIAKGHTGIVAPIDITTGIIKVPAEKLDASIYERHPTTGEMIIGFNVPFWNDCISMAEKAAKIVPEVGYIGWDIAITSTGPIFIEGNTSPGYSFNQLGSRSSGIGNRAIFEKYL